MKNFKWLNLLGTLLIFSFFIYKVMEIDNNKLKISDLYTVQEIVSILGINQSNIIWPHTIKLDGRIYQVDSIGVFHTKYNPAITANKSPFDSMMVGLLSKKDTIYSSNKNINKTVKQYFYNWNILRKHGVFQARKWGKNNRSIMLSIRGGKYLGGCIEEKTPFRFKIKLYEKRKNQWCVYEKVSSR